jgi:O-antigen/teichoic acid export membrane protein
MLSFVFMTVILIAGYAFGRFNTLLLIGAGINLVLSTTYMLLRSSVAGLGFYRADSWLSALDKLFMIFFIGVYIYLPTGSDINIYGFVLLQALSYIISSLIAFGFLYRKLDLKRLVSLDFGTTKKIIKSCLPYAWILVFMTIYSRIDGVLLAQLIDDNHYQTGIYAACYRFYDAANMATFVFGSLLYAMYARFSQDIKMIKMLVDLGFRLGLVVAMMISTLLIFWGKQIMGLLLPIFDTSHIAVLSWLMIAYVLASLASIFTSLMMAIGNIKLLNFILGAVCCVNVVLHLILIPKFGALGAAITMAATQALLMIGIFIVCRRNLDVSINILTFARSLIFILISIGVAYGATMITNNFWMIQSCIALMIIVSVSFVIKLINIEDVIGLFQSKNQVSEDIAKI